MPQIENLHNKIIIENNNYDNLLLGAWKSEVFWLDEHWDSIAIPVDEEPDKFGIEKLENFVNLTMIISALEQDTTQPDVNKWIKSMLNQLASYLSSVEEIMLDSFSSKNGYFNFVYSIPFFLMEKRTGVRFQITRHVESLVHNKQFKAYDHHDTLLLASLAGDDQAAQKLKQMYMKNIQFLKENPAFSASQAYDLTHEILYCSFVQTEKNFFTDAPIYLEKLITEFMPQNIDLGAELLSCYWICGGESNMKIKDAMHLLREFVYNDKHDFPERKYGKYGCPKVKAAIHHKLTAIWGLSTTLLYAGEILTEDKHQV